jgi:hypothetical protein
MSLRAPFTTCHGIDREASGPVRADVPTFRSSPADHGRRPSIRSTHHGSASCHAGRAADGTGNPDIVAYIGTLKRNN